MVCRPWCLPYLTSLTRPGPFTILRPATAGMNQAPRTLSYNPAENAVLLTSDVDGGSYELYKIPKDARGDSAPICSCVCALFCCVVVSLTSRVAVQCLLSKRVHMLCRLHTLSYKFTPGIDCTLSCTAMLNLFGLLNTPQHAIAHTHTHTYMH